MKESIRLKHEFVDYIPDKLDERTVYVSIAYATAAHKCCCGCGNEVITPLSPMDWKLIFDGESISLYPSIGNWNFTCQSHYWIEKNTVKWAPQWSQDRIKTGRAYDVFIKDKYFGNTINQRPYNVITDVPVAENKTKKSFWEKIREWFS